MVFGVPFPLAPGDELQAPLTDVLNGLVAPGIPFRSVTGGPDKSGLVDGGIGVIEGRTADRMLVKYLPLSFNVKNIRPTDQGALASVTVSGPAITQRTADVAFVGPDGGWRVSSGSARSVLSALGS
jgi:hypothetical protein